MLQRVAFDFQPDGDDQPRRLEVRNHALKHVACSVVSGCQSRLRVRNHALTHVAYQLLSNYDQARSLTLAFRLV
jgi:hypothetical protein